MGGNNQKHISSKCFFLNPFSLFQEGVKTNTQSKPNTVAGTSQPEHFLNVTQTAGACVTESESHLTAETSPSLIHSKGRQMLRPRYFKPMQDIQ